MEENAVPVVALREGSSLLVQGDTVTLLGPWRRSPHVAWDGARLFSRDSCRELLPGDSLDFLVAGEEDVIVQFDTPRTELIDPEVDNFKSS